jgi:hypothetical protein
MGKFIFNPFTCNLDYTETGGGGGTPGPPGQGVPVGGSPNQVLAKKTAADYDTQWQDQSGGGITVQQAIMYSLIGG